MTFALYGKEINVQDDLIRKAKEICLVIDEDEIKQLLIEETSAPVYDEKGVLRDIKESEEKKLFSKSAEELSRIVNSAIEDILQFGAVE